MTFLGFRHAKRKAKKMVNIRPLRSPTPSSGSLTTSIVEIGDPSGASAEACHAPVTLDVDITPEPRFLNDPFSSTVRHHASTNPRQLQDRLSRSVLGRSLPKPLRDETEWVQPRVSVLFDRASTVGWSVGAFTLSTTFRMAVSQDQLWLETLFGYVFVDPRCSSPTQ
jgi:hypothetical protein